MIDLIPIFARVIVKPKDTPDKIGSIYIPNNSKELEATEGEVIAVGDECEKVKVGDHVYYGKYSGFKFDRGGQDYVYMNEEDILGIVIKLQS